MTASPGLTLRPLAEEDLPAIAPWFADPETVRRLGDAGWPRRLLSLARAPGRHAFLALAGGEPVALADVDMEPSGRAALALVVAPGQRRRGVARALLDALAERPELARVGELVAGVEAGNAAGLALARAAGATPTGDGPDAEGFVWVTRPFDPGRGADRRPWNTASAEESA